MKLKPISANSNETGLPHLHYIPIVIVVSIIGILISIIPSCEAKLSANEKGRPTIACEHLKDKNLPDVTIAGADSTGTYSSSSDSSDNAKQSLKEKFKNPPSGYGEVPFYWWNCKDSLTRKRLLWQLKKLHESGVQGFSVSYAHSHPKSDPELNQQGYGTFGMTYPSEPTIFSDEWWDLWNWFTGECAKRDMGLGLDDYTLAVPGNKQWPDKIAALPEMRDYRGKLWFKEPIDLAAGEAKEIRIDSQTISLNAFPVRKDGLEGKSAINLLEGAETREKITWTAPEGSDWQVIHVLETDASYMLHPQHGEKVIEYYFQRFEDHVVPANRKGLNYFFQDELTIDLGIDTWAEDFPEQFRERKGYDIRPYLAALHYNIGTRTPRIRLDYMDVLIDLAEARYFRPIFEWHHKRGLIYGCDNYGRGLEPTAYGDYFRATRWYTAPGNDAPQGATALTQTKVSSSVSHLYDRPRVWLEAFHSMGWGAYPGQIIESTDIHYLLGGNLLCLHGLYYSTYGSWWEWAPPDFHFRMPYWPHMKKWLKYIERLSYLLSQGHHVCDVAVIYPTTPMQAYPDATPDSAFSIAHQLYNAGIDFDFIDYSSLKRAKVKDVQLHVANEQYRVLVLGDMKAMRFTSLNKALELFRSGGLVLANGALTEATDRTGSNDPKVDSIVSQIFGLAGAEAAEGRLMGIRQNHAGGMGKYISGKEKNQIPDIIESTITADFLPAKSNGHVCHRRVGKHDIYMVMEVPEGTECFFRSHGKVELWNAWTGETEDLPVVRTTPVGSIVRIPKAPPESSLIVFSPGEPEYERATDKSAGEDDVNIIEVIRQWECELVPTMNNQWGDFRLPSTNGYIGPEARQMRYSLAEEAEVGWKGKNFNDSHWERVNCDFGPRMWKMKIPEDKNIDAVIEVVLDKNNPFGMVEVSGQGYDWEPYEFSWRRGVKNQPGSQGYHGLKGKISDNFLIMEESGHFLFGSFVHIPEDMLVHVVKSGAEPYGIWIDGEKAEDTRIQLSEGLHHILVCYKNVSGEEEPEGPHIIDERTRSAVILSRKKAGESSRQPLSMRWDNYPGRLNYDLIGGKTRNGCYRFTAPPGLHKLSFPAHGDVKVWVNSNEVPVEKGGSRSDGSMEYTVQLKQAIPEMSTVALRVNSADGFYGGAVFPKPINLFCNRGLITTGDWSEKGVLKHYSGGMWYRKHIRLNSEQARRKMVLDLGKVGVTCEVHVNGKKVGILLKSPYTMDISDYVKRGDNHLEILIYNTLSNHYQTIPTPEHYKNMSLSGLTEPVKVLIYSTEAEGKM